MHDYLHDYLNDYVEDAPPVSLDQAVDEHIREVGRDCPDEEWLLSPFDSWHRNPFYRGAPGHPEDDFEDDDLPF